MYSCIKKWKATTIVPYLPHMHMVAVISVTLAKAKYWKNDDQPRMTRVKPYYIIAIPFYYPTEISEENGSRSLTCSQ